MDRKLDVALTEIRTRISQADPLLVRLINFAVRENTIIQYGVAVRLGGITVLGIPSPSHTTGEILDTQTLRFVQMLHAADVSVGKGDGNWPEVERNLRVSPMFASDAKSDDEAYSKLSEKLKSPEFEGIGDIAELPEDLAAEAILAFAPPKALTLTSAIIRKDDGMTEDVGNIRINLSAIEAWWVFDLNPAEGTEDALAKIQHSEES
jgi:hypothetical protein